MKINRTVSRAIDILAYASANPSGVSLEMICQHFSIPKTSAYDILITLVQSGMLMISTESGSKQLYRIGMAAYQIGMAYTDANDELKLISSVLKRLVHECGRTAFFGKLSGSEVLYILKEIPENPIITTATLGSTAPLYCTSLGKVLLAYMPTEQATQLISQIDFIKRTEFTLKNAAELSDELTLTRSRGYALDMREYEEHMACASSPVFTRDGELLGAVSISSIYRPDDDYESVGKLIAAAAAEISRLIGYRL